MGNGKWSYEIETGAVIRALRKIGYKLLKVDYDNGYGRTEGVGLVTLKPTQVKKAISACSGVDSCHLFVGIPGWQPIWLHLIYGNSPGELVADWSIPLNSNQAKELDDAISRVQGRFYGKGR